MKKSIIFIFLAFLSISKSFSQDKDKLKIDEDKLLKEFSENACKCIDSITVANKSREEITDDISYCIDKQTTAYQMGSKLLNSLKDKPVENKKITIEIASNEDSNEYKKYFFELERYLMTNCKAIKSKVAADNGKAEKSVSENKYAIKEYNLGQKDFENKNYKKALVHFNKAVLIDDEFTFAWDNIGICNRYLENYDEAIKAYEKSIEINPNGLFPLQNLAIVYAYKKEFDKAIVTYERMALIDSQNPEVFYGIGQVSYQYTHEYEKSLKNMCKAYNLYVEQKSPYRTDAEKIISLLFTEFKKQGNETRFHEILKENNLNPED